MLNERTIAVIKSTVPVLAEHGTAITKCFYKRLFTNHPELLNIFNHANQHRGRQPEALAGAVYAAAAHIDNLEAILPAVRQIAHKHRSLGIRPEQYPIVGENLLAAIKEVLGDAATDEIIQAWAEAYGVIADVFISVEAEMYRQAEQQEGGWADFRPFVVQRKERESETITSFYLVPQDGGPLARFVPGQYVSVKPKMPGEQYTHIRQYSLSDAPGRPYYRITVKREDAADGKPAGKVSTYLHTSVREGDVLQLSAPAGDFTLDAEDDRPIVLLSGGVGLTPLVSMLNTLAEQPSDRSITFIHAALRGSVHALKEQVNEVAARCPNVRVYYAYSSPTEEDRAAGGYDKEGLIDAEWLRSVVPQADVRVYLCGPTPFMAAMYRQLLALGVRENDIRYEFFGPQGQLLEEEQAVRR